MQIKQTFFNSVHLLDLPRHEDSRGWFSESQHQQAYAKLLNNPEFACVQSNVSASKQYALRGLHAQIQHPQDKLIQVLSGSVYDVFVDIRPNSPTIGQWDSVLLSEQCSQQLWIPRGFAHGFLALAPNTIVLYHCSHYYVPNDQLTLLWNDVDLNINWPLGDHLPILSEKDQAGMLFKDYLKCAS